MIHQLSINYFVREEASAPSPLSAPSALRGTQTRQPELASNSPPNGLISDLALGDSTLESGLSGDLSKQLGKLAFEASSSEVREFVNDDLENERKEGDFEEMRAFGGNVEMGVSRGVQKGLFGDFVNWGGKSVDLGEGEEGMMILGFGNSSEFEVAKGLFSPVTELAHVSVADFKTPDKLKMNAIYDEKTDITRNMPAKVDECRRNKGYSCLTDAHSPVTNANALQTGFLQEEHDLKENLQFLGNLEGPFTPSSFLTPLKENQAKDTLSGFKAEQLDLAQFGLIQDLTFEELVESQRKVKSNNIKCHLEDFELEDDLDEFEAPSVCLDDFDSVSDLSSQLSVFSSAYSSISSQSEGVKTVFSEAPVFSCQSHWKQVDEADSLDEHYTSLEIAIQGEYAPKNQRLEANRNLLEKLDFSGDFKLSEDQVTMEDQLDSLFGLKQDDLALTVESALKQRKIVRGDGFGYVGVGLDYDYLEQLDLEESMLLEGELNGEENGHQLVIIRIGCHNVEDLKNAPKEESKTTQNGLQLGIKQGKSVQYQTHVTSNIQMEVASKSLISKSAYVPRFQFEPDKCRCFGHHHCTDVDTSKTPPFFPQPCKALRNLFQAINGSKIRNSLSICVNELAKPLQSDSQSKIVKNQDLASFASRLPKKFEICSISAPRSLKPFVRLEICQFSRSSQLPSLRIFYFDLARENLFGSKASPEKSIFGMGQMVGKLIAQIAAKGDLESGETSLNWKLVRSDKVRAIGVVSVC